MRTNWKDWTPGEEKLLLRLWRMGLGAVGIGSAFGRSAKSVKRRLERLEGAGVVLNTPRPLVVGESTRARSIRNERMWTPDEIAFLKDEESGYNRDEIADVLDRTRSAVTQRFSKEVSDEVGLPPGEEMWQAWVALRLGEPSPREKAVKERTTMDAPEKTSKHREPWTPEDEDLVLRMAAAGHSDLAIGLVVGRTVEAVGVKRSLLQRRLRARALELEKDPNYLRAFAARQPRPAPLPAPAPAAPTDADALVHLSSPLARAAVMAWMEGVWDEGWELLKASGLAEETENEHERNRQMGKIVSYMGYDAMQKRKEQAKEPISLERTLCCPECKRRAVAITQVTVQTDRVAFLLDETGCYTQPNNSGEGSMALRLYCPHNHRWIEVIEPGSSQLTVTKERDSGSTYDPIWQVPTPTPAPAPAPAPEPEPAPVPATLEAHAPTNGKEKWWIYGTHTSESGNAILVVTGDGRYGRVTNYDSHEWRQASEVCNGTYLRWRANERVQPAGKVKK